MHRDFSDTAALLGDPGRAAILMSLMGGVAMPAGQLAMIANIAPQTASTHLSKLVDGRLLMVEQRGRHRYYRLANSEVAHAIETLLAITPQMKDASPRAVKPSAGLLAYARTCYSHLAGALAVELAEAVQTRKLLARRHTRAFEVTAAGLDWLRQLGIAISDRQAKNPEFARCCLDWTERRDHIAGPLGSAMLTSFRQRKWIAPVRNSRAVRVTLEGQERFWELLRIRTRN